MLSRIFLKRNSGIEQTCRRTCLLYYFHGYSNLKWGHLDRLEKKAKDLQALVYQYLFPPSVCLILKFIWNIIFPDRYLLPLGEALYVIKQFCKGFLILKEGRNQYIPLMEANSTLGIIKTKSNLSSHLTALWVLENTYHILS